MEILIGLFIGIVFFIATISAYILGIKHKKQIDQGVIPKINPVKVIMDNVEQYRAEKKQEESEEELADIMSYTKESALKAIKKEGI